MAETITDFIRRDLRARVSRGEGPADLTLAGLSAHYRVSPTPVRQAVRDLVADGVLVRGEDGRLAAGPAPSSPVPTLPEPPIDLEASLTAEVIRLSLAGRAVHLREEATAARFGVGRSALRQALGRLAGKGLIEYLPRRGWRVRAFDEADLRAYLAARECLELKALDLAMPQLDRADLEAMLHGNEPGAEGPRLDNQLHRHLVEKAGNPYIRDFFERHGLYFTTLLDFAAPEAAAVARMAGQHRAILVALLAGDRRAARRELARHIRAQLPVLRRLLRRHGRPTPANGDTP